MTTPGCANFLLCHLPSHGPDAAALIEAARSRGLYIRNVESMGTRLGTRAVRIAVKDRATNGRMLDILAELLGGTGFQPDGGQRQRLPD